jgi:hypothetical protein
MCEYVVSMLDNTEHKQVVDQRNTFAWAAEFVYRETWSLTTEGFCAFAKTSSCVSLLLNSVYFCLKVPDKSYSMKCHWNWVTMLQDVPSVTNMTDEWMSEEEQVKNLLGSEYWTQPETDFSSATCSKSKSRKCNTCFRLLFYTYVVMGKVRYLKTFLFNPIISVNFPFKG